MKLISIENKIGKTILELKMSGFGIADVLQKNWMRERIETREIYH